MVKVGLSLFLFLGLLFVCEYLVYYVYLFLNCHYPHLASSSKENRHPLKALFIADTHLLGSRNGHWFDKLRREWQMYRSFQTASTLFQPDVIFFLGDIFDEGKWCSDKEFDYYVRRFYSLFSTQSAQVFVVQGNHDIGFHFAVYPHLDERFKNAFSGTKSVRKVTLRGNVFVLVNSMAMDRTDKCFLCRKGEAELKAVNLSLNPETEPRPILLQHFPLYRSSDAECEELDEELKGKESLFKEGYDCLSRESTDYLIKHINPRLALTGHTHNKCRLERPMNLEEITVPSFSWRYRNVPSFYISVITPDNYSLQKCDLPPEDVVINLYIISVTLIVIFLIFFKRGRTLLI